MRIRPYQEYVTVADPEIPRRGGRQLQRVALQSIIIARKRSLGQGNMFTPVCHSVPGGGAWSQGGGAPGPRGGCLVETPPGRLLLRAVRILLECILV